MERGDGKYFLLPRETYHHYNTDSWGLVDFGKYGTVKASPDGVILMDKDVFENINRSLFNNFDLKADIEKVRKYMESTFGPVCNRKVPAIYDPSEMKKLCSDAGADKLFDFLLNTMTTEVRQTAKKIIENEHKVVTLIHLLAFEQSQKCSYFQHDNAILMKDFGLSDQGLNTLRRQGLTVHSKTSSAERKQKTDKHSSEIQSWIKTRIDNKEFMVVIIDDYTNIHSRRRPKSSETNVVSNMTTIVLKTFPNIPAIPISNVPLQNPEIIEADKLVQYIEKSMHLLSITFVDTMPPWIKNKFFYPESERVRLTTHDYSVDDDVRIMRGMTNLKLVDSYENPLKKYEHLL